MIEQPVGAALNRDLWTQGEQVEGELDRLISQRDRRRREEEGDRAEEAVWKEAERPEAAKRAEEYHRSTLDMQRHLRSVYLALFYEKRRRAAMKWIRHKSSNGEEHDAQ